MDAIRVSTEQFRRDLAEYLNRAGHGGEEIVVERYGKPIAILLPYSRVAIEQEEKVSEPIYLPGEQVPTLAREIEAARYAAGLSYEEMAERLLEERIRTLREKYPEFAAEHVPS